MGYFNEPSAFLQLQTEPKRSLSDSWISRWTTVLHWESKILKRQPTASLGKMDAPNPLVIRPLLDFY